MTRQHSSTAKKQPDPSLPGPLPDNTLYQMLFSQSRDAIIVIDADSHRIVDANPAASHELAYSQDDLRQLSLANIIGNVDLSAFWQHVFQEGHAQITTLCHRQDGSPVPVEVNAHIVTVNGRRLVQCVMRDITRQLQREEDLRLLSQAVEQSPAAIVLTDTDGTIEYVNPQFTKITGYAQQEAIGQNSRILKTGHTTEAKYRHLWQTISSGKTWRGQLYNRRKDGSTFWESVIIAPVFDLDGDITHYLAIKEDITQCKQVQKNLQERNRQLLVVNQILQTISTTLDMDRILRMIVSETDRLLGTPVTAVWLTDPETEQLICRSASPQYADVLLKWELSPEATTWILTRQKSANILDIQAEPRHIQDMVGQFTFMRSILIVPLQTTDGVIGLLTLGDERPSRFQPEDVIIAEAIAAAVANAIRQAQLYQDLQKQYSRLEEMHSRLVQAEKLAALGELVAGVAHELNNPLTSITLHAELLAKQNINGDAHNHLEKITEQARRAAQTVHRLLDFSRQRPLANEPTQTNDLLQKTVDLLSHELHAHNITIKMHLDEHLPIVIVDPQQIQQVFVNLILNAMQAIGKEQGKGSLTLRSEQRADGRQQVIRIVIEDDGPGIPPQIQARIFDPFFTTKPQGQGTGLGLSVCHGIITRHNGRIWVESETGQGAAFFIELPVLPSSDQAQPQANISEQQPDPLDNHPRILIVDDEESIMQVLIQALHRHGYTADGVLNGTAALERLAQTDYDLVICDLRMPEMSGGEMYKQAVARNPSLSDRFIFTTGDISGIATTLTDDMKNNLYLEKPFSIKTLLQTINRVH